jgi:hypothetical protein
MESLWRRPLVFKDPTLLQVLPEIDDSDDLRIKVRRLEEAVRRLSLSIYIARQPGSETRPTNRWPYR